MLLSGIGASNEHARMIINSYKRVTGKMLLEEDPVPGEEFDRLYQAPIVVLSHGLEPDPVLNFGNLSAQKLWEMEWTIFTRTPSRLTAEPINRDERDRFLHAVSENGFVDNYTGIRISSTGRRFYILEATVWNLTDDNGSMHGQAASFREYRYI